MDVLWNNWNKSLCEIIDKYIPEVQYKNQTSAPWIDSEIIDIVKKKNVIEF